MVWLCNHSDKYLTSDEKKVTFSTLSAIFCPPKIKNKYDIPNKCFILSMRGLRHTKKKRISFEMTFNCSDVCINHSPDLLMTSCFIVQILYYTFEWNNVFCLLSQCCNLCKSHLKMRIRSKQFYRSHTHVDSELTTNKTC